MARTAIQNTMRDGKNQTQSEPVIRLEGVSKTFEHNLSRFNSFKEMMIQSFSLRRRPLTERRALEDISFEVRAGEAVGIVGKNGSGKTTLLNLIAGVTQQTCGSLSTKGRVVALTDLNAGFHIDLSGMENIFLCAALVGISRKDVFPLLDDIQDFAGLDEFIYTPVKHYSSGMLIRLAFSMSVHFSPDILLLDEILACGDRQFQYLSLQRIRELKRQGVTIFFVSHRIDQVEMIADRIIWLDQGRIKQDDATTEVVKSWTSDQGDLFGKRPDGDVNKRRASTRETVRLGTGEAIIERAKLMNSEGEETCRFREGELMVVEVEIDALERCENIECSVFVQREDAVFASIASSSVLGASLRDHVGKALFRFELNPMLAEGLYLISYSLSPSNDDFKDIYDLIRQGKFWIESSRSSKVQRLFKFPTIVSWSKK